MSDHTWAKLYVPTELTKAVKAVFDEASDEDEIGGALTALFYEDMRYGYLPDGVQDKLIAAGIPFDWEWSDDGDFNGGLLYIRFTETGELHLREVYNRDRNPNLKALLERIDKPDELVQFLKEHADNVTPLSWDNQVEYGKRYRMRQLVLPT